MCNRAMCHGTLVSSFTMASQSVVILLSFPQVKIVVAPRVINDPIIDKNISWCFMTELLRENLLWGEQGAFPVLMRVDGSSF